MCGIPLLQAKPKENTALVITQPNREIVIDPYPDGLDLIEWLTVIEPIESEPIRSAPWRLASLQPLSGEIKASWTDGTGFVCIGYKDTPETWARLSGQLCDCSGAIKNTAPVRGRLTGARGLRTQI